MAEKEYCAGCGVCSISCPVDAIKMSKNKLGFFCPEISSDLCIGCGACDRVCPTESNSAKHDFTCVAASCRDNDNRVISSSGGVFGVLADFVVKQNGAVYGAVFDEEYNVVIKRADSVEKIHQMHGAKYVQSIAWEEYWQVLDDVKQGKQVLFTGLPCQVAALKNYLHGDYNNLYCVEVACHGVPSTEMFHVYLQDLSKKMGADSKKIMFFSFRNKLDPRGGISWKNYFVECDWESGVKYIRNFRDDAYMKAFFCDLSVNPYCYTCNHKLFQSCADLTIGDFWGIEKAKPEINDDKGISLVVIHTSNGENIIESCRDKLAEFETVESTDALKENPFIAQPPVPNKKQKKFQQNFVNGKDYMQNVRFCLKSSIAKRLWKKFRYFAGKVVR